MDAEHPEDGMDGMDGAVDAFWENAKRRAKLSHLPGYFGPSALESLRPPAWSFGATPEQADALLELVLSGTKTATSSALRDFEGGEEPFPEPGGLSVILDGSGAPRALIVTTEVRTVRFDEVDAEHARLEGEGDLSLEHWRDVHERFFTDHSLQGEAFGPDLPVVLERFKVLYSD